MTVNFSLPPYSDTNHYDDNILRIEKFDPHKVWVLALNDASLGYPYLKRFEFEVSAKPQRFVGSEPESSIILLTDTPFARLPGSHIRRSGCRKTRLGNRNGRLYRCKEFQGEREKNIHLQYSGNQRT